MSLFKMESQLLAPQPDPDLGGTSLPAFTQKIHGEATENDEDEMGILNDQDLTEKLDFSDDENLGAKSKSLDMLEDEPKDFAEGQIDVKEQMDRAAEALDSSLRGQYALDETPLGALEEVEMKTDQELALRHHSPHAHKKATHKG